MALIKNTLRCDDRLQRITHFVGAIEFTLGDDDDFVSLAQRLRRIR